MSSSIWERIIVSIGLVGFVIIALISVLLAFNGLQYSFDLSNGWAAFIVVILTYSKFNIVLLIFALIGLYQYII
jgi:hypothetical protein